MFTWHGCELYVVVLRVIIVIPSITYIITSLGLLPHRSRKRRLNKLDARALYPDSSLADLYDPLSMPPELRKAHDRNNAAVMKAYGFTTSMSETECVAALMKMYQELTSS